jgi:hypothetical protein
MPGVPVRAVDTYLAGVCSHLIGTHLMWLPLARPRLVAEGVRLEVQGGGNQWQAHANLRTKNMSPNLLGMQRVKRLTHPTVAGQAIHLQAAMVGHVKMMAM